MCKEIEALVEACSICQERRNSAQKEPMISHPIPERPWQASALNPSVHRETTSTGACLSQHSSQSERSLSGKAKLYYDKTAKAQPALPAGAAVRFQLPTGKWEPTTIVDSAGTQRSYNILTEDGQVLRRNRRHLLKTENSTNKETPARDPDHESTESMTLQQDTVGQPGPKEPLQFTTTKSGRIVKPRAVLDL
ncbi:hypothetical protein N1851_016592 [Merluccius polli]|uniref:Uncharacterized protein n=1 Tax=Merluccius polli TaxID=89951 RepID=A0AA47P2U3_MERPO|nr:hypothetical protein N1851_016592 [Merluccius polli]